MRTTLSQLALSSTLFFAVGTLQAVTIDFVTVGNPGNAPDTRYNATGFGAVDYTYRIGKYEITAGQYTEFLNAVAADDTFGLYSTLMWSDSQGAKIQRTGSAGSYNYSVAADWANRPVNFVSFWDAARFANWLHNGQPTGPQVAHTTEGGAYVNIGNQSTFSRQAGAKYFIPTENEWYKGAYHNQSAGVAAGYFDYATGTNGFPGNDITETTNPGNNINYRPNNYAIGSPYWRTEVGKFGFSVSPYGTFDQSGNVAEWNETAISSSRIMRGGSFGSVTNLPAALSRDTFNGPTFENSGVGFRIASVVATTDGDFDLDGDVDGQDFLLWQRAPTIGSLADWLANYGSGLLSDVAVVPEPTSLILFALALMTVACRPRLINVKKT